MLHRFILVHRCLIEPTPLFSLILQTSCILNAMSHACMLLNELRSRSKQCSYIAACQIQAAVLQNRIACTHFLRYSSPRKRITTIHPRQLQSSTWRNHSGFYRRARHSHARSQRDVRRISLAHPCHHRNRHCKRCRTYVQYDWILCSSCSHRWPCTQVGAARSDALRLIRENGLSLFVTIHGTGSCCRSGSCDVVL